MFRTILLLAATFFLSSCAVEVDDLTSTQLTYNPPINTQEFRVRVRSNRTIDSVDIDVEGASSTAMAAAADDQYTATVPVPNCAGVVNYTVTVDGPNITSRIFPPAGRFSREVLNIPDACDDFAGDYAQTFVVDQFDDFVDDAPGDGFCEGAAPNNVRGCSLRAAVMEANASSGDDLIVLPNGRFTITRAGDEEPNGIDDSIGDYDITGNVTIQRRNRSSRNVPTLLAWPPTGDGTELRDVTSTDNRYPKIDGGGLDRLFQVRRGATLRLRSVMLVNGESLVNGGAVLNQGTLTLNRVIMVENTAGGLVGFREAGGAIHNAGELFGTDSVLAHNTVRGSNPMAGAISNESGGTITLKRMLVAFNVARFGTAIRSEGTLRMENVVLHGNRLNSGNGGAVENQGSATLNHVTFSSNVNGNPTWNVLSGTAANVRNTLFIGNRGGSCGAIESYGGNVTDLACTPRATSQPLLPDSFDAFGQPLGAENLTDLGGFFPVPLVRPSDRATLNGTAGVPTVPLTDARGLGFPRALDAAGEPGTASDVDSGAVEY